MAPHNQPDLHAEAKRVFSEAIELPPDQRPAYVGRACGADSDLRREVLSLIENYDATESFFERPVLASDPMLGRTMGAYKILRQIGAGGMGAVYLAERADAQYRKR